MLGACASFGSSSQTPPGDVADAEEAAEAAPIEDANEAAPLDAAVEDAGPYPPGGDFERDPEAGASCGDWEVEQASASETHPGYQSNGACQICGVFPSNLTDVYVRPGTWITSPPVGTNYEVKAWIEKGAGITTFAKLFVDTSIPGSEPPAHEGPSNNPASWALLTYVYRVQAGDSLLRPGLHVQLTGGSCVTIDDFSVTVVP